MKKKLNNFTARIAKLANADNDRLKHSSTISQLTERIESLQSVAKEWKKTGQKRLAVVTKELEKESYAAAARKQLNKLDKELAKLGYDASAHDEKRREELELREIDEDYRKLDSARQVIKQIESEIKNLEEERAKKQEEIAEQEKCLYPGRAGIGRI